MSWHRYRQTDTDTQIEIDTDIHIDTDTYIDTDAPTRHRERTSFNAERATWTLDGAGMRAVEREAVTRDEKR